MISYLRVRGYAQWMPTGPYFPREIAFFENCSVILLVSMVRSFSAQQTKQTNKQKKKQKQNKTKKVALRKNDSKSQAWSDFNDAHLIIFAVPAMWEVMCG
jgi:hypothetical protein